MATRRLMAAKLHLLTARPVQAAGDGDHGDGGGQFLRVNGPGVNRVLRCTAPSGKRREMGLEVVHRGSTARAGDNYIGAREVAQKARDPLRQDIDPLVDREQRREAERRAAEDGESHFGVALELTGRRYHGTKVAGCAGTGQAARVRT